MSAFNSIFAVAQSSLFSAFGRLDVGFQLNCGTDAVIVRGVFRVGEAIAEQQKGVYADLYVLQADLPQFPTKKDGFLVDGVPYIIAKEPLDCQDGLGGLNLRLRKR